MCAGEDMTLLLAKALVEGTHIQGAESVWRGLGRQHRTSRRGKVICLPPRARSLERLEERSCMLWNDLSVCVTGTSAKAVTDQGCINFPPHISNPIQNIRNIQNRRTEQATQNVLNVLN